MSVTYRKDAGESVSRILSLRRHGPDLRRNFRRRGAMIIPLGPGSLRDSSSLPEGRSNLLLRARCIRAGPALPSYLTLLHAGFSVPRMLPFGRWALTPPFHPYLCVRPKQASPKVSLLTGRRGALHTGGLIFCGTVRSRVPARISPAGISGPLALPGALP